MTPALIKKELIPKRPGVYLFKDADKNIIYVGKAIDLYHRVASYFSFRALRKGDVKTSTLVEDIKGLETIVVESEIEALILEANLIKKYLPKFNVRLTDDRDYLYIGITKGQLPKVITLRKQDLKNVQKFWGPFPSAGTVRNTLKTLRRIFPWCSNLQIRSTDSKAKPCFYYHLGLCVGPCAGVVDKKDYQKIISNFSKFMDGKKGQLLLELNKEMEMLSKVQKYEQANIVKKTIQGINYLTQNIKVKLYLENPNFLEEETKKTLLELKNDLKLTKIPERIECYDISNIQGHDATGSMVVLTNGQIDKAQYRKFKIKISGRPNDVGMLKEMIKRRLNHKEWLIPDLVLVDGGRGQVNGIWRELQDIPVFGLAKRMEWLYPKEGSVIKLPKKSLSLKLLQKIRDEAHRFAITYHRKLRDRIVTSTIKVTSDKQ